MFLTKDLHVDNSEITINVDQSNAEMVTLVTDDQEYISVEHQEDMKQSKAEIACLVIIDQGDLPREH